MPFGHMLGQLCEPLRPLAGGAWEAGAVVLVPLAVVLAVVLDVAAFAIAAPPPASAAVIARVLSSGLIRRGIFVHLLWSPEHKILGKRLSDVGQP